MSIAAVLLFMFNFKLNILGRFTVCLLVFLSIFISLDYALYSMLNRLYARIETGPGRLNWFKQNRYDILIMGSSTAKAYYDDMMSEALGLSVLNISLDGSSILYSRCLLEYILYHQVKPKFLILNVDLFEVLDTAWGGNSYANMDKFLPVYGSVDYIDRVLNRKNSTEFIKFYSKSYRFNNTAISILRKSITKRDTGYFRKKPEHKNLELPVDPKIITQKFSMKANIDYKKLGIYKEIIETCQQNGIKILFCETPAYYPSGKMTFRDKESETIIEKLCNEYLVPFLVFSQDNYPVFSSNTMFQDVLHLNYDGGKVFSNLLAEELKSLGLHD